MFHIRFHGNHDFLFLAFYSYTSDIKYYVLNCPAQEAVWQMFMFVLSYNKDGWVLYPSTDCVAFPFPWQHVYHGLWYALIPFSMP